MRIDKAELRKLVLESFQQFKEQSNMTPNQMDQAKKDLKQNTLKHIHMLKLLKATVNQVGTNTELKKMIEQFRKSDTSKFLKQVLNVKDTITVRTEAVFENPMELINDIIDEVLKEAIQNAQKRLAENMEKEKHDHPEGHKEGDLPFLTRDETRLEKHKAKERKKHGPPKPDLHETETLEEDTNGDES